MTPPGLFEGPAPRLRATPASAPFLDVLADALVAALAAGGGEKRTPQLDLFAAGGDARDPLALSDALILLPNRRAARGLMDAFARRLGGAALLPTIRPLGDPYADDDPDVWGAEAASDEIPPPIDRLQRRMQLAALIRRRDQAEHGVEDPARAIALADELAKLLDSAATVDRVDWGRLHTLVEERELAQHWASSAAFLDIVAKFWPLHLAEQGRSDVAAHGAQLRKALAARWRETPPQRPIVIAGSTGSIATTRELMAVVAGLPCGVVVLPGLDIDLDDESWALLGDQHPQHALKDTLTALGVDRREVPLLGVETAQGLARRMLIREALAPPEKTADWLARLAGAGGAAFVASGARELRVLEAATEDEEAAAIALLLRETLERKEATAALVTPDAGLARRVEAKLARWGVAPEVSHGRPLRETEAGALVALLCELSRDAAEPVAFAALLKHPRVALGRDGAALATLEHKALRGPRRHRALADLEALPDLAEWPRARGVVADAREALAPLTTLMAASAVTLGVFADALAETMERLAPRDAWRGRDGEQAAALLRDAIAYGAELGEMSPHAAPRVLMRLMEGRAVAPEPGGDPRVAIWGLLEARLQRRDVMILGGLNEGVWPAPAGDDPFLSRGMRDSLGLPSLDARIGLAAHDFAQLANAPAVVFTRALRRDGAPTLASRWLWRLETLAQGAQAALPRATEVLAWARALDAPAKVAPAPPPAPRPPADQRLTQISVTTVETLIRDPYAVYARRLMRLEALDPIGAAAGPAERGIAVHRAIELFGDGEDVRDLMRLLDEALQARGVSPERRAAERERLAASANTLIAWFRERRRPGLAVHREARGELQLDRVKLTGVADRIEIADAQASILDFKTGVPPTDLQVQSGLSPQLLLEAAMLAQGAFPGVTGAQANELIYWRFGGADPAPRAVALAQGAHAAGLEALAALQALLAHYADPASAFLSKPRVLKIRLYDDYDQLARRKEWADEKTDEL